MSRNPVESFVSLKIAIETNQWMLTDVSRRRTAQVEFNEDEFATFLASTTEFYTSVRRALRLSGQVPFEIGYDELSDVEVLNGLAAWLGVAARLEAPSARLKRQNTPDIAARLTNPEVLAPALARLGQHAPPSSLPAEPERNAAIHCYVAARKAPLLFLPVPGGPARRVKAWLAALDDGDGADLRTGFGFRTLREWRTANLGHRSFTVVRHPLERAHAVYCARILVPGPECFGKIRAALRQDHGVALPEGAPGADYDAEAHRAGLVSFLRFVKRNLAERTSIRIDPSWASQEAVLRGFARRQLPDMVIREEQLETGLAQVAAQLGRKAPDLPPRRQPGAPHALAVIHDDEVEAAARAAYGGDYEGFGYGDWRP